MNTPSLIYLENRAEFYTTLLPRVVSHIFADALEKAVAPLRESDEHVQSLQQLHESDSAPGHTEALCLDDLFKKPGFGRQLAMITTSVREALKNSERIELLGYTWFQTLSKQDVASNTSLEALAASRLGCLSNILKLRDEMDFHRLRLL